MTTSEQDFPPLLEKDCPADPYELFGRWFAAAERGRTRYPNAMNLATVDSSGRPDARVVLLKDYSADGFIFYTNTLSAKGVELKDNPCAALTFYWDDLMRQIRIRGEVFPVSTADADAYFKSRPRGSQIGAHASLQSTELESRSLLEQRAAEIEAGFAGREVPRPAHWSGYLVAAGTIEFWQERLSRMHDRIRYSKKENGDWRFERLYP